MVENRVDALAEPALQVRRLVPRRTWFFVVALSVAILIPCFWLSRIQSADLSSHIYNAWLVTQIRQGKLPGLWLASQSNNVLFDSLLEWLFLKVGPNWAQHIAVSVSVLIFVWGAKRFIERVSGKNPWFIVPCVSVLAYGYIFHIGFFNFYLSMGLCLWYLALVWMEGWRTYALASFLLILAWIAHPFPVIWAVGIAAYLVCVRNRGKRARPFVFLLGISSLVVLHYFLLSRYRCEWSPQQAFFATGANQLIVFGLEFVIPCAALLLVWLRQFRKLTRLRGLEIVNEVSLQLWILNAMAIVLVPNQILFPQFDRQFGYVTTRLSLGAAILLCSALASVPVDEAGKILLAFTFVAFFALLYRSERRLNQLENRLDTFVAALPTKQRMITRVPAQSLSWLVFQHDLDRVCIGRCFSYANFEPSSGQFRVRARSNNGVVLNNPSDVDAVRTGKYVVRAADLPLRLIFPCGAKYEDVCSRDLRAGEMNGEP